MIIRILMSVKIIVDCGDDDNFNLDHDHPISLTLVEMMVFTALVILSWTFYTFIHIVGIALMWGKAWVWDITQCW